MSSSNNSGERCCCFLFPIRRDRCERAFERFEQVTVSHGRPQTSQNVRKRPKTSQNIPMSEIGWAMPVTAVAGENTTVAPVPANAVPAAVDPEEETARQRASLRKWLDSLRLRLGEAWLPSFPNTTAAAAALQPLVACEVGAGPVGGKRLQLYCRRVGMTGCIEALGKVGIPEAAARLLYEHSAASLRRRKLTAAAPVATAALQAATQAAAPAAAAATTAGSQATEAVEECESSTGTETLIVSGKDAEAIGSDESDALHLSCVEKPAPTATAVHVDAVGRALGARIVGNHAGGAMSPTDLAAMLYGNCGYCGARLEDRWRPVVDSNATCDGCYVSQSTIGAQTVELRFDMNVEVISYAAPAGYEATLEAQVAADVREWEKMRRALAPQNLKVMGNRTQVPFPNKTAKGLTEHQQAAWGQTHLGNALASDEKARTLHARLDQDVQKLIDLHIGRISAAYDALYPSATAGSGSLEIGAVEVVDVYGPAPWQFVHNKRVPTGGAQWLLVVAEGGTPTEHLWWKGGVEDAKRHLRTLRREVLGNDCVDEVAFEEELKTDGDLGAIASAMTSAEDAMVGRRFMYPHALLPGHLQMFRDANHRGGPVQENKSRTLVIGLAFKHDGVSIVPEAPKQMHGALKLAHLGLNCTVQNSIRLQEQLHGDFITGLDFDFGGGRSKSHWKGQRLVNPAYTTRKAAEGAGPSSSAVAKREGSTSKRPAPKSKKQRAAARKKKKAGY